MDLQHFIVSYRGLLLTMGLLAALLTFLWWYAKAGRPRGEGKFKVTYLIFWPWLIDQRRMQQTEGKRSMAVREIVGILAVLIVAVVAILIRHLGVIDRPGNGCRNAIGARIRP
jgi:hypothetical protein